MTVRELALFCQEIHDSCTVEIEAEGEWVELDQSKLRAVLTADQLDYVDVDNNEDEEGS